MSETFRVVSDTFCRRCGERCLMRKSVGGYDAVTGKPWEKVTYSARGGAGGTCSACTTGTPCYERAP
jgi:hypothetical protein